MTEQAAGPMQYRELGRTGLRVSALGFGCMRFLTKRGRETWGRSIDAADAVRLLLEAADLGINYFDTAYNYHGGASEGILGTFLKQVPRHRVLLATKSPVWKMKRPGDFRRLLNVQLKRLGTNRVDLYLLHALHEDSFRKAQELGALEFLDAERRSGRIGFAGFSFHDKPFSFIPITDAFDWDFCQIQYNIIDTEEQAGRTGLMYAAGKGLGVVVMEPLRGGDLIRRLPPAVKEAWSLPPGRTEAELCLQWIWNHPEVSTVLSGMNCSQQLTENARLAAVTLPGSFPEEDLLTVERVRMAYSGLHRVGCTMCGYCLPCPAGVYIPRIFNIMNEACMFPESRIPWMSYNTWLRPEQKADRCTGCGLCEERCPQRLPIREKLRETHALLAAPPPPLQ
jgi:uncharacterized protein